MNVLDLELQKLNSSVIFAKDTEMQQVVLNKKQSRFHIEYVCFYLNFVLKCIIYLFVAL